MLDAEDIANKIAALDALIAHWENRVANSKAQLTYNEYRLSGLQAQRAHYTALLAETSASSVEPQK